MTLDQLKPNQRAEVVKVSSGHHGLEKRLKTIGFLPGAPVRCLRKSPTGGVVSFRLRHGVFAIETPVLCQIHIRMLET